MIWAPNGAQLILWLHVLAACVWIGGQLTIALLVPMLRGQPALLAAAARRYQLAAWFAFAVLVITGIANVHNAGISWTDLDSTAAGRTLEVKLLFVLLSGAAAAVHAFVVAPRAAASRGRVAPALSAILGTASLLAATVAALYGVVIAEH
jgi:putative copper export protein